MNPLQIATITTSLAPIAARSLAKIADIFSLDGNATDNPTSANETAPKETANVSKSTDTDGNSTPEGGNSPFSQLYQSLTEKLQSLLQQLPQLDGSDSSLQVTIQSDGKLKLQSEDPTVDLENFADWLNQDSELSELAADTLRAKQDAEWRSGLSKSTPSTELNLRIQLGSAKTA